jgi:ABC-type phosphate transport system permease subunit
MMIKLIIDVVLFSCMFAFVTGIVLAGAHVLG